MVKELFITIAITTGPSIVVTEKQIVSIDKIIKILLITVISILCSIAIWDKQRNISLMTNVTTFCFHFCISPKNRPYQYTEKTCLLLSHVFSKFWQDHLNRFYIFFKLFFEVFLDLHHHVSYWIFKINVYVYCEELNWKQLPKCETSVGDSVSYEKQNK